MIKSGTYTVLDSGTATWSYDSASGNAGFVQVMGDVVTVTSYAISTAASPTAGGSVSCSPNPTTSGSSTCTATANSGYTFSSWSGDCTGATSTCTLSNVTAQKSVTAVFSVKSTAPSQAFDVIATASGDTSSLTLNLVLNVNSADIGTQGNIYLGAKVPVSATKDAWFFNNSSSWVNWTGGGVPAYFTGTLPSSQNFPILRNNDARAFANVNLYAGYGRDVNDMLARGNAKLAYTVPGASGTSPSDPFALQSLISGTTTSEIKSVTTSAGQSAKIQLTDGTNFTLPAATKEVTASLERKSNASDLTGSGVTVTGTTRELTITSSYPIPDDFTISLNIPFSEFGTINLDTVNITRIGDTLINDQVVKNSVTFLPVRRSDNGGNIDK